MHHSGCKRRRRAPDAIPINRHRKDVTMRIPPPKSIIAFESVARTKSVNRAAEELGLTASAVSHQLSNLEALIGRPLFQRSGRGLVLTPTGERYLADVTGSLADLSRATERASSRTDVDILRVHSSPSFGLMWLLPRLSSFQEANGDLQLNLACSYENVSFSNGYYDIDIRHGYGNWDNLEVKTVRGEYIAPLASPAYLERHPVRTPEDLLAHRLIYSETPLVQWKQWFGRTGVSAKQKTFDFSFDRSYMSIETAALGLGIALESLTLASVKIRDGLLVPVFDDSYAVEVGAHHLVYPSQNAALPRIQRFLAWIEREAAAAT
ncbi:Glycine cleavage system transcriptional activator [Burkholderia multivorans]|nr:transcriptional regulator, LysR family [Burkholderia multivorans CGD1]MDR9237027.1 Glycine cleavage system transcriptional activator [Burkholderia multivorans]MDR9265333.1 Glycine cleavage system transcriptional activator [Burkholderia multivorans]MDR9283806.1 Glycine cleavage system transcriptional activator [Burkholderia multivorans]MDR9289387.1 Glycine cleavage system transcriptional activator [Burkholderia multivorans]